MLHLFTDLGFHTSLMLVSALFFVLVYEFINGFHDTANAVATIIYTRSMHSKIAVVMSGIFNFFGVLMGGLSVAYAIVHLLPTDLLLNASSVNNLSLVFSILLAAILWNLSTWYSGLPASSSHTLIGAIIGVGITNALVNSSSVVKALNIPKLIEIFLSLILSPIVGLVMASIIMLILQRYCSSTKKHHYIHLTPIECEKNSGRDTPPLWTCIALVLSAAGISFFHGANDGQKGIGLIMLILIGVAPAGFVVNLNANSYDINRTRDAINHIQQYYKQHPSVLVCVTNDRCSLPPLNMKNSVLTKNQASTLSIIYPTSVSTLTSVSIGDYYRTNQNISQLKTVYYDMSQVLFIISRAVLLLDNLDNYNILNADQRLQVRYLLMRIVDSVDKVIDLPGTSSADKCFLLKLRQDLLYTIEYAPLWIIVAVALALSLGTVVGWRRMVITIGERIGKKGMTYAQGLSAQMTTAISIGVASCIGMPVSTTHVLSSAVTGTMLMDGSGVHGKTVKNIFLAWVLTLPVTIILAGSLYWLSFKVI